MVLPNFL